MGDGETTSFASAVERKAAATQRTFVIAVVAILAFVFLFVLVLVVPVLGRALLILLPFVALAGAIRFSMVRGLQSLLVRAPRAARRAEGYRSAPAEGPLAPGHAVLRGRVAYAQGRTSAMQVDLIEYGTEIHDKSGWTHFWKEESRKLTAGPFYLVRGDGRRVRIEPDARTTQLFDDLEWKVEPLDPIDGKPRRNRVARLDAGEEVWVIGELEEGDDPEATDSAETGLVDYRESARPPALVMRAAPALLVSSVPLVDHFVARAQLHRMQGMLAILLVIFPLLLAARFVDRAVGHTVMGTVERVEVERGKHGSVTGFRAYVRADGVDWESASLDDRPAVGTPFPLRLGTYSSNDGPNVQWTTGERVASAVIFVVLLIIAVNAKQRSQGALPWYRWSGNFVEVGRGRLRDS
jgi:hypothetical protein